MVEETVVARESEPLERFKSFSHLERWAQAGEEVTRKGSIGRVAGIEPSCQSPLRSDEIGETPHPVGKRLSGIAPVIERSGKQQWIRWRYFCPTFFRQSFHEYAASPFTIPSGPEPITRCSAPREGPSCCGESPGLQMDSYYLEVLAKQNPLQRGHLPGELTQERFVTTQLRG